MLKNTKRKRGGHFPPGEIKYKILLYLLDNTDGIDEPTLREFFKNTFNISEPKNIKKHLEDLRKKRCIKKSEKSGFANHWAINNRQHVANIVELYPKIVPYIQNNDKIISLIVDNHKSDIRFEILGDLLSLSPSFFKNYLTNDSFFEQFKIAWFNLYFDSSKFKLRSESEVLLSSFTAHILFEMFIHCVIEDNINNVHIPDAFEFIGKNQGQYCLDHRMAWRKGYNYAKDNTWFEIENRDY